MTRWHEQVFRRVVVAAAARETVREPRVLDLKAARGCEHVHDLWNGAGGKRPAVIDDAAADHHVRVRGPRTETPSAGHAVTAVDHDRAAVRRRLPCRDEIDVRVQLARAALVEPRSEE